VGSALWRIGGGQPNVTMIVKATFGLVLEGSALRITPLPILRRDRHVDKDPVRSLECAAETAPVMFQVGVTVVGHCHAIGGAKQSRVRLVLRRGSLTLIDKSIAVYGDRDLDAVPQRFERMTLGYERALGGEAFSDNPIGIGAGKSSPKMPNLVDPTEPYGRVACFGPTPAIFPARRRLRGSLRPQVIERGIADYPADFSWNYFQAAPIDQRLNVLHGDEWLELHGMHPQHSRIRTRLPAPRALCHVYNHSLVSAPASVPLALDTLHIEPDAERCSLVWRGSFPIASELAAESLLIGGAVELPGETTQWPATAAELEPYASPPPETSELDGAFDDDLQQTAERSVRGAALEAMGSNAELPHTAASSQTAAQAATVPRRQSKTLRMVTPGGTLPPPQHDPDLTQERPLDESADADAGAPFPIIPPRED
jgi:hypothetical protein